MKHRQQKGGFSLIETLVAIGILLVALVGPLTIATKGLEGSRFAREQVTATFLAQEGVELAYKIRNEAILDAEVDPSTIDNWDWVNDSTYADCFSAAGCGLAIDDNGVVASPVDCTDSVDCQLYLQDGSTNRDRYYYGGQADEVTQYTRIVTFEELSSGEVQVNSTVSWEEGLFGGSQLTVSTVLYDTY